MQLTRQPKLVKGILGHCCHLFTQGYLGSGLSLCYQPALLGRVQPFPEQEITNFGVPLSPTSRTFVLTGLSFSCSKTASRNPFRVSTASWDRLEDFYWFFPLRYTHVCVGILHSVHERSFRRVIADREVKYSSRGSPLEEPCLLHYSKPMHPYP